MRLNIVQKKELLLGNLGQMPTGVTKAGLTSTSMLERAIAFNPGSV